MYNKILSPGTHRPLRRNPVFLVGATRDNFQRFAGQWSLQRSGLVPDARIQTSRSLVCRQDHRHSFRMFNYLI
jgi:hypothetical protein